MKLKELRKSLHMTQQQFADSLKLERVTYVRYENGTRSIPNDVLMRIAEQYHVTTDYLLDRQQYIKQLPSEELEELNRIWRQSTRTFTPEEEQAAFDSYKAKVEFMKEELLDIFDELNEFHQERVLDYARFALEQYEKEQIENNRNTKEN